jgi:polyphosphate kinase 2 (PPK2 family)
MLDRVQRELTDSYDEELEMELEDREIDPHTKQVVERERSAEAKEERRLYFRELFRLQAELVKLQDWVVHTGHKVVIIFEGRDAAGKGGVIKRIVQRLNPRVCRVAACRRRTTANAPSGTSSATSRTCRPPAKSCCSTAAGTTAPASSA